MLYIDKQPVTGGKFPNKETYVDFDELHGLNPRAAHELTCKFESNDDLVNLMLYKKSLDDAGFTDVGLFLPYLPYAALDRTEDKRCLGAKHVGAFLNDLKFSYVRSWEAHSNVALATVDRIRDTLVSAEIYRDVYDGLVADGAAMEDIVCVFPDDGAKTRYKSLRPAQSVTFGKGRRFKDGKLDPPRLLEKDFVGEPRYALVVDDLCRGGRTVCAVAAEVRKAVPGIKVLFCVAHTEDTVYTGPILSDLNVDGIYTTDSCLSRVDSPKLHVVRTILDDIGYKGPYAKRMADLLKEVV